MVEESGECRAALASRLPSTWTMRSRSAMTQGTSGARSMCRVCRPPPLRNAFRALVHQDGQFHRSGGDRQRARLDARRVQQIADQLPHPVGLGVDDPVELARLGRVQRGGGVQQGGDRAF